MRLLEKEAKSTIDRICRWMGLKTEEESRITVTLEGELLAYGSLVAMSVFTIVCGAFRSVECLRKRDERLYTKMTKTQAAMFPIVASCMLCGIYLYIENFPKDHINLLFTFNFFFSGMSALTNLLRISNIRNIRFSLYDEICLGICCVLIGWYIMEKHWIANNLLAIACTINGIEHFHVNNVVTGCIFLTGLFVYDAVWVFGTNIMASVARSVEAPVKLAFPGDILEKGLDANNFAILGSGDMYMPGIFVALMLRFDSYLNRGSRTYFNVSLLAYIAGLMTAIFIGDKYENSQPALLYLAPACVGAPLFLALIKGDFTAILQYEDHPLPFEGVNDEVEVGLVSSIGNL